MIDDKKLRKIFKNVSREIDSVNKSLEQLIPKAIIRETSSFGNSSHIVLSKDLLNKKVGVLILGEKNKGDAHENL